MSIRKKKYSQFQASTSYIPAFLYFLKSGNSIFLILLYLFERTMRMYKKRDENWTYINHFNNIKSLDSPNLIILEDHAIYTKLF